MALLRVLESHVHFVKGVPTVFPAGQLLDADSPLIKGREHLFGPAEDAVRSEPEPVRASGATETADATPGTARALPRPPAKKAAAKKAAENASDESTDGDKD